MKPVNITWSIADRAIIDAHDALMELGLLGERPELRLHADRTLPTAVYQPRTNTVVICAGKLAALPTKREKREIVFECMAMCGCHRSYQKDMRMWNDSQNKARIQKPVLAMQGGSRWRFIKQKLEEVL